MSGSRLVQTIDSKSSKTINTISAKGSSAKQQEVIGGKTLIKASELLAELAKTPTLTPAQAQQQLAALPGVSKVVVDRSPNGSDTEATAALEYQGQIFSLTTIPSTPWVAIASIEAAEVYAPGQELLNIFGLTALVLGSVATGVILLLSRQLSRLSNYSLAISQVGAIHELPLPGRCGSLNHRFISSPTRSRWRRHNQLRMYSPSPSLQWITITESRLNSWTNQKIVAIESNLQSSV